MSIRDREPLTPEERDLAQRLSRLGGHAQPPAALDAKILAAARDAVQPGSRRPRPRWPLGVGIAASLALAVGVAWQLRPLPEADVMHAPSETTTAAAMRDDAHAARVIAPPPARQAERAVAPAASIIADDATAPAEALPSTAPAPAGRTLQATPRVAADEALRQDPPEQLMLDIEPPPPPPAAPSAPPAAAPAAAMPAPAPAPADATKTRTQEQERRAPRSESATAAMRAAGVQPEPAIDTVTVTGSRVRQAQPALPERADEYIDEPLDDRPPASFATAEARDAWLQRIRELVAEGELDAARASLKEFRRRYPQHPVPADLKALPTE